MVIGEYRRTNRKEDGSQTILCALFTE